MFGLAGPDPGMLREYKYTGNNFVHKEYFRRYEYKYDNPETGDNMICYLQTDLGNNSKPLKKLHEVLSERKSYRYYVGHYESNKFKEQMHKYRTGKIKTRPNGRKWCLLMKGTVVQQGEQVLTLDEFYADPNPPYHHYDDFLYTEGRMVCDN